MLDSTPTMLLPSICKKQMPKANCNGQIWRRDSSYKVWDAQLQCAITVGYRLLASHRAPPESTTLAVHFHGTSESPGLFRNDDPQYSGFDQLPASVLFIDYRGFGWSDGDCRVSALFTDAEQLVQQLPQIVQDCGLPWPYPGLLILM